MSDYGLVDSEVRKKAWPLLLNIDTKSQERRVIDREEALENEFLSTKETHWKSISRTLYSLTCDPCRVCEAKHPQRAAEERYQPLVIQPHEHIPVHQKHSVIPRSPTDSPESSNETSCR